MSSSQDPSPTSAPSTNFLAQAVPVESDTTAAPVSPDLPSDFFSQMSTTKMESPESSENQAEPAKTFFAHTVNPDSSILATNKISSVSDTGVSETKENAGESSMSIPTDEPAEMSVAEAEALVSMLSMNTTIDTSAKPDSSIDDVYRDVVRKSLSSERPQGGIAKVRTYTVLVVACVLGGGGWYAYSSDAIPMFTDTDATPPPVLDSAPPAPVLSPTHSGADHTGATKTGTATVSDAPALDLVPRDSGVIVNKKRNNNAKKKQTPRQTVVTEIAE